jgi:hypothetical protein
MSITRICLPIIIVLSVFSLTAAQETQRPQDAWLQRAQSLINDSLKDAKSLETLDNALVLGQLGAQWWNIDRSQARKWLLKAVEAVELEPAKESGVERRKRLAVAHSLLPVIATADQKLWERLQNVLTSGEPDPSETERTRISETLVETALAVLKTDPRRAAAIGSTALRLGPPRTLQNLLWDLRRRDPLLADRLFREALTVAGKTYGDDFLNSLRYAAFPELLGTVYDPAIVPPDALQRQMLLTLADYLQQQTAMLASRGIRDCGVAPALVEGLQIHFDRLQPQRAELVRQIVRTCSESRNQSVADTDPQSIGIPETVDSLLTQADQTADKKMKRPHFLARAARLAAQQKDFELAIKILESMSEEERKFIGIWETWRRDWAAALAIEFIKRDDAYGMRQVIKAVPDALRSFDKIYFVDMLPKDSSLQIARDFLDESRKDLAKAEIPDLDKAYWYLMMVRLYSKCHLNGDAVEAFKDAIGSLNRVKSEETNDSDSLSELNRRLILGDFPVSLLESHDYPMKEAVSSITSVPRRVRLRLDLLEFSIAEYRAKAAKFTPEQKALLKKPK